MWRILVILALFSAPAFGQALSGINGDCQIGGQQALTSGLPSTGTQQIGTTNVNAGAGIQASFPQCLVSVYLTNTTNKANIYSNGSLTPTPLSNPFVANVDGSFTFFAAAGCYDVTMSSGAGPALPYSRSLSGICVGQGTVVIPGGSGTVGSCGTPGALSFYSLAGTASTCDPNFVTDGSGNAIATSMTFNGAGAGFVGFVQGTLPPIPVANTAYFYSDTSIPTTFGTALPTNPGTLNQVWGITQVVDATHIKTGWIGGTFGCLQGTCVVNAPTADQTITGAHQLTLSDPASSFLVNGPAGIGSGAVPGGAGPIVGVVINSTFLDVERTLTSGFSSLPVAAGFGLDWNGSTDKNGGEMAAIQIYAETDAASTKNVNSAINGFLSEVDHNGSGTVAQQFAGGFTSLKFNAGTITLNSAGDFFSGGFGGTITNDQTVRIESPQVGATYTNPHVGLYIADQTISGVGKAIQVVGGANDLGPQATTLGSEIISGNTFGAALTHVASACETTFGITTLSTGATTTDTGLNCLPANSIIDAVVGRVTTTITAACTGWELGDAATPARFSSNNTVLTAGTTTDAAHIGTFNNTGIASATAGTWQASAAKVRITCAGGNPGAGAIRVIVYSHTWTAPTS